MSELSATGLSTYVARGLSLGDNQRPVLSEFGCIPPPLNSDSLLVCAAVKVFTNFLGLHGLGFVLTCSVNYGTYINRLVPF